MPSLRNLAGWMARLRGAEGGVAAVEFALILPIMLLVYIGTVEASALISMDRKVQTVSGAVGDLVARSRGQITSTELGDYVKVASGIMTPYSAAPLKQIITEVRVAADRTTSVEWSKPYVNQTEQATGGHAEGSSYPLPDEIIDIAVGQFVIVAESSYSYRPLYGIVFDQAIDLYHQNFYLPRFGDQILLDP